MAGVIDTIRNRNRADFFDEGAESSYNTEAGVPAAAAGGTLKERDTRANPINPPEPAPPAKGLRKP